MHDAAFEAVQRFSRTVNLSGVTGRALDLGGRDVNGTVHSLFPNVDWTVLDRVEHPSVDIVADVTKWWPERETWSLVVSTETIEHVEEWWKIIEVAYRALVPGGYLIVTGGSTGRGPHSCTGVVPVPEGEHYGNVAPGELWDSAVLLGFERPYVEYNPDPHFDVYMLARKP
jgi:SAM-dependent methyltransferase